MYRIILRRLLLIPFIIAVVSFLIFLAPLVSGIDPATAVLQAQVLDRQPTPEAIERLRKDLGLDRHLLVQYVAWLWRAAQGDMGRSYMGRVPVSEKVFDGLKVSATLSVVTLRHIPERRPAPGNTRGYEARDAPGYVCRGRIPVGSSGPCIRTRADPDPGLRHLSGLAALRRMA